MKKQSDPQLVWGTEAIAQVIQLTPRQTYYLLRCGRLPVRKVGTVYVGEREALLKFLTTPEVAA